MEAQKWPTFIHIHFLLVDRFSPYSLRAAKEAKKAKQAAKKPAAPSAKVRADGAEVAVF